MSDKKKKKSSAKRRTSTSAISLISDNKVGRPASKKMDLKTVVEPIVDSVPVMEPIVDSNNLSIVDSVEKKQVDRAAMIKPLPEEDDVSLDENQVEFMEVSTKDPRKKTFVNSIRIVLDKDIRSNRKVDYKVVYQSLCLKFGQKSKAVSLIQGIGRGVEECSWIVAYDPLGVSVPEGIVDQLISVNGFEVIIENASVEASQYAMKR